VGYKYGPNWSVPASSFQNGPVGFESVIQPWFRYYIKAHIREQLSELESNEGVLQLGTDDSGQRGPGSSALAISGETIQANADGNCVNATGKFRFMADRQLLDMPLDVSALNLDWVAGTTDKLFKDLTTAQRTILFLYFHEEQSFKTLVNLSILWMLFVEEPVQAHGASLLLDLGCTGFHQIRLEKVVAPQVCPCHLAVVCDPGRIRPVRSGPYAIESGTHQGTYCNRNSIFTINRPHHPTPAEYVNSQRKGRHAMTQKRRQQRLLIS